MLRDTIRDDMAIFYNSDDFGVAAVITTSSGSITVSGIVDAIADTERLAATSQSGRSAWAVGAADASISKLQFSTPFQAIAAVIPEDTLAISEGEFAGTYRIKQIMRDGDMALLRINTA